MQIANRLAGYSLGEADLAAPRHGQEKSRRDGAAARAFRRRRSPAQVSAEEDRKDFRSHGTVRRIRLQQIALRRLRAARLSHRIFEDALSRRVYGRSAHLGHRQHRRRREVHQRMPRDGHRGRSPRYQRLRRQLHAARRSHSLRPCRSEERWRQCHRIDRRSEKKAWPLQIDLRILRKRRPPPAQQARARVVDQERRHGFPRPPRPADGCSRPRHGSRAESPARRGIRSARPVRSVPAGRLRGAQRQASRTFPTGTNKRASPPKKKFSASSSAAILWKNTKTSCRTCRRSASRKSAR